MENYTRIPDSIRKNKSLTSTEKIILGYLYTYQNKLVGKTITPTGTYCFETQENLSDELGISISALKKALVILETKKLIFKKKKGHVDGKSQYKNRLAIIMVDENNQLPTESTPDVVKSEPKKVSKPIEVVTPEVDMDDLDVFFEEPEPIKLENTPTKKIVNKLILQDIVRGYLDNGDINTGQSIDLYKAIENELFYYAEDLELNIKEHIDYNIMCKSF